MRQELYGVYEDLRKLREIRDDPQTPDIERASLTRLIAKIEEAAAQYHSNGHQAGS